MVGKGRRFGRGGGEGSDLGESRKVLHIGRGGELSSRSDAVCHPPLKQDRLELCARRIDGCGVRCGARAHDAHLGHQGGGLVRLADWGAEVWEARRCSGALRVLQYYSVSPPQRSRLWQPVGEGREGRGGEGKLTLAVSCLSDILSGWSALSKTAAAASASEASGHGAARSYKTAARTENQAHASERCAGGGRGGQAACE